MFKLSNKEMMKFRELQKSVAIQFSDENKLIQAFTHSSYVNEHQGDPSLSNERLEFLGDAVLELTISKYLYEHYPEMLEGQLTKIRAAIVCEPSLVKFAINVSFGEYILLGRGEERMSGRTRPALLADVFEAFIGALYMDQGLAAVVSFLEKVVFPEINKGVFSKVTDYKSLLQEEIQRDSQGQLAYKIIMEDGPPHDRIFESSVFLNGEEVGNGRGKTKKEAEQMAAAKALEQLQKN